MEPKDEEAPGRTLLTALGAMAGVAVIVGLAVGLVAVGAFKAGGAGAGGGGADRAPQSLYIPKYQPTESSTEDEWPGLPSRTATTPASPTESPTQEESPRTDKITLFAAPVSVAPGERINLNGVYLDGEGVALQVQRKEGAVWSDFADVTASVRGGVFNTWIQTSRTGVALLRVFDPTTGRASNTVKVTVG